MKALVVDDSSATRFIIARMLREIGCSVVEAENGEVALDVLGQNQDATFALIDWNMPVMNGFDLVQAIRQQSNYDDVKVMMVTTETEMTQVVKAIEAGANEYLMKPFTKEMLLGKIALLGIEVPVETE